MNSSKERQRQREAEVEQRRQQGAEQREAEATARSGEGAPEALWIASGNPAETFEEMWREIQKEVLMERRRATLSRIGIDSVI